MPRARKSASGHPFRWLLVIALVSAAAWAWFYFRHRPAWNHMVADLSAGAHAPAAHPCATPLVALPGGALAASRTGALVTIEQLRKLPPGGAPTIYKVQARLLSLTQDGAQIRLHLGSLVNPSLTLDAWIPGDACSTSQEDTALFDELREVATLRFGPLRSTPVAVAAPTQVLVTAPVVLARGTPSLRPVLDLRVQ